MPDQLAHIIKVRLGYSRFFLLMSRLCDFAELTLGFDKRIDDLGIGRFIRVFSRLIFDRAHDQRQHFG